MACNVDFLFSAGAFVIFRLIGRQPASEKCGAFRNWVWLVFLRQPDNERAAGLRVCMACQPHLCSRPGFCYFRLIGRQPASEKCESFRNFLQHYTLLFYVVYYYQKHLIQTSLSACHYRK